MEASFDRHGAVRSVRMRSPLGRCSTDATSRTRVPKSLFLNADSRADAEKAPTWNRTCSSGSPGIAEAQAMSAEAFVPETPARGLALVRGEAGYAGGQDDARAHIHQLRDGVDQLELRGPQLLVLDLELDLVDLQLVHQGLHVGDRHARQVVGRRAQEGLGAAAKVAGAAPLRAPRLGTTAS